MVVKDAAIKVAINGAIEKTVRLLDEMRWRDKEALDEMLAKDLSRVSERRRVLEYAKTIATSKVHEQSARTFNCSKGEEYVLVPSLVENASRAAFDFIKREIEEFSKVLNPPSEDEVVFERRKRSRVEPPTSHSHPKAKQQDMSDTPWKGKGKGTPPRKSSPFMMNTPPAKVRPSVARVKRDPSAKTQETEQASVQYESSSTTPGGDEGGDGVDCTRKVLDYIEQLRLVLKFCMDWTSSLKVAAHVLMANNVRVTRMAEAQLEECFTDFRDLMVNCHPIDATDEDEAKKLQSTILKQVSSPVREVLFNLNFTALKEGKVWQDEDTSLPPKGEGTSLALMLTEAPQSPDGSSSRETSQEPGQPVFEDFFNTSWYNP